jgi:hypothetical protein
VCSRSTDVPRNIPTVSPPSFHLGRPFGGIVVFRQFQEELIPSLAPGPPGLKPSEHFGIDGDAGHGVSTHGLVIITMVLTI